MPSSMKIICLCILMITFTVFTTSGDDADDSYEDIPDYIIENVDEEDFQLNDLLDSEMMDGIREMDDESQLSAERIRKLLCKDFETATKMATQGREGRALRPRYCANFCLDFYNWCRRLCFRLVEEEESNYIEILPCLTACTMHLASCCFT